MLLEFTIVVIIIAIVFLFIMMSPKKSVSVPRGCLSKVSIQKDSPVVVVFGASGIKGVTIIEELAKNNINVIGLSRTYNKWYSIMNGRNDLKDRIQWMNCDVRVHREIEEAIRKIKKDYGRIDAFINAAVVGRPGVIPHGYTTGKDGKDIFIRLVSTKSTGTDNMFFTNFIGLSNLLKVELYSGTSLIINPKRVDAFSDLLLTEYESTDIAKCVNIKRMNLTKPSKIVEYITKSLSR